MLSTLSKSLLFFSSFSPLMLMFAAKAHFSGGAIAAVILAVTGLLSICFILYILFSYVPRTAAQNLIVESTQRKDGEVMSYIVTYIFPFLSTDLSQLFNSISLLVLYLIIFVIYVSTNMIHVNPVLSLLGYKLFELEMASGHRPTVITRQSRLLRGQGLRVVRLAHDIFIDVT